MRRLPLALLSCATLLLAEAGAAAAANTAAPAARQVLYGDLHIHTALSADAFSTGTRTLPDDAYRYARGEAIAHAAGFTVQLKRPLDFAAVTEHSDVYKRQGSARACGDRDTG